MLDRTPPVAQTANDIGSTPIHLRTFSLVTSLDETLQDGTAPPETTRRTGCAPMRLVCSRGSLRRSPGPTKQLLVQEVPLQIPAPAVPPVLVEAEVLAVAEAELPGKVHRL